MNIQETQQATQVLQVGFTDIAQDSKKLEFSKNESSFLSLGKELMPLEVQTPIFAEDTLITNSNAPFTITGDALLANDNLNGVEVGRVSIFLQEFREGSQNGLLNTRLENDTLTFNPSQENTFGYYSVYDTNDNFVGATTFKVNLALNGTGTVPVANDDLINVKGVQSIDGKYNSFRERSYTGAEITNFVKLDVLGNDVGENLKLVSVDNSGVASFAFSPINIKVENGEIFVAPKAGFKGEFSFDYTISDGINGFSTGNITLNIDPNLVIETTPAIPSSFVTDDVFSGRQNAITRFSVNDLLSNDQNVTFDSISDPNSGTLFTSRDGKSFTYLPNEGFVGNDVFEYTTTNSNGEKVTGKITIEIPVSTAETPVINSIYSMV